MLRRSASVLRSARSGLSVLRINGRAAPARMAVISLRKLSAVAAASADAAAASSEPKAPDVDLDNWRKIAGQLYKAKQFRELEQILKLVSAPTNPNLSDRVASLKGLSSILSAEGRHEEAEPVLWEVLDMLETACKVELEKADSVTWPAVFMDLCRHLGSIAVCTRARVMKHPLRGKAAAKDDEKLAECGKTATNLLGRFVWFLIAFTSPAIRDPRTGKMGRNFKTYTKEQARQRLELRSDPDVVRLLTIATMVLIDTGNAQLARQVVQREMLPDGAEAMKARRARPVALPDVRVLMGHHLLGMLEYAAAARQAGVEAGATEDAAAALATTAAADGKRAAARIPANLLVQAEVHWRAAIQYADPLLEHMVAAADEQNPRVVEPFLAGVRSCYRMQHALYTDANQSDKAAAVKQRAAAWSERWRAKRRSGSSGGGGAGSAGKPAAKPSKLDDGVDV